jgi:hypothetical protein
LCVPSRPHGFMSFVNSFRVDGLFVIATTVVMLVFRGRMES